MTTFNYIDEQELVDGIYYVAMRKKVNKIKLPNGKDLFFDDILGVTIISPALINYNDLDGIPEGSVMIFVNTSEEKAKASILRLINEIDEAFAREQFAGAGVTI